MKIHKSLFLIPMVAVFLAGGPMAQAEQIANDGGCTGPFYHPTPTFPSVCDIMPNLCDDEPIVLSEVADALVDIGQQLWLLEKGAISAPAANQKIRNRAAVALESLEVTAAVRNQTLETMLALNRQNLPGVASHAVSVGAAMAALGGIFLNGAETNDEVQTQASSGTVTTTTTGGFEINFGIFKIFSNQTVTTVETTDESEGEGYTEETDEDGNSVCVEK